MCFHCENFTSCESHASYKSVNGTVFPHVVLAWVFTFKVILKCLLSLGKYLVQSILSFIRQHMDYKLPTETEGDDIYKTAFKRFKQTQDLSSVIDFKKCDIFADKILHLEAPKLNKTLLNCNTREHFKCFDQWKMYTLKDAVPGLIIIPGILKESYRLDWYRYFHDYLPTSEDFNLRANIDLSERNRRDNLRWITFGYHHNWDSKVYCLDQSSVVIPERIQDLCSIVSSYLGSTFEAQAGIVNYYNRKSNLCFHTDHSELDHSLPLYSFSLGAPAIFLIGGLFKNSTTPISAILLRDSDLLIMSGESRLALHAVAKIVPGHDLLDNQSSTIHSQIKRINVNVRQVMQ